MAIYAYFSNRNNNSWFISFLNLNNFKASNNPNNSTKTFSKNNITLSIYENYTENANEK